MKKRWLIPKLLLLNSAIFFISILVLEASYRVLIYAKTCFGVYKCKANLLKNPGISYPPKLENSKVRNNYGLTKYDEVLGFDLNSNFSAEFPNIQGLPPFSVSIDKSGMRNSYKNKSTKLVLTVGDSFTFGHQVDDNQTWQSCLNKNQDKFNFINGGVGGYGTVQSVMRAKKYIKSINPDYVLISILNYGDLLRDKMSFFSGFPSISVIKNKGVLEIAPPPGPNILGSKYYKGNLRPNPFIHFLHGNSRILLKLNSSYYGKFSRNMTTFHKKSASLDEIANFAIDLSNSLGVPVYFLIQYEDLIPGYMAKSRMSLKKIFESRSIKYIDTWDVLHGRNRTFKNIKDVWQIHHTPLGNEIVCKAILDSEFFVK